MKDYLITFVRLLLGIDQAVGSGHLSCVSCNSSLVGYAFYESLCQPNHSKDWYYNRTRCIEPVAFNFKFKLLD